MKRTFTNWNWKNITLFVISLATAFNAIVIIWRLTIEPFYTNQLTTLTWFGLVALIASIIIAITCWSEFWNE